MALQKEERIEAEVRLIEEAAARMAGRVNLTFVVDPAKRQRFKDWLSTCTHL